MPATLEDVRPTTTPGVDDGEFVDFGWRPIFKEHTNRKNVRFGRQAMQRIADRCNERITDTKDFCPITVRHTVDDGSRDPEVVGFFGPFRAQKMPGENGKWAVYARERIYKQDADKRRKYPRVSVEYWADENDPTGGYFDPASLLGAETPELDLGIHYSADPSDPRRTLMRYQRVTRYEATPVAAGGSNTFVPSDSSDDPDRYEANGTLSEADLRQIITALKPVIDEAVNAKVAAMQPVGADPNHDLTPEATPADGAMGGMESTMPGESPAEMMFAEPGDDAADADIDGLGDADGGQNPFSADDSESDDSTDKDDDDKSQKYSADGRETVTVSFEEEPAMADTNAEVARYQKEAEDYRKKHDGLLSKYQKLEVENTALKTERDALQAEKRKAVRYAKLNELHASGIVFDLDNEIKEVEDLNDAQFDRHCERIKTNYSRVPLEGMKLPEGTKIAGPARTINDDKVDAKKRDRYSKMAMDAVTRGRKEKKAVDFKSEFDRLMDTDPENIGKAAA